MRAGWLNAMMVLAMLSAPLACDDETTVVTGKDRPRGRVPRPSAARPAAPPPIRSVTVPAGAPNRDEKAPTHTTPAASSSVAPPAPHPGLRDPKLADLRAPDQFEARFATTRGPVSFRCERSWSPHGVDRFYSLVVIGYFTDVALYRVVPSFVAQWGIHGDPSVNVAWRDANLPAEPVTHKNVRGTLSFAMAASPTTRSTQLFINYGDNTRLDAMGFAPVCVVSEGMAVADAFNSRYADTIAGRQGEILARGNTLLRSEFPGLDYIIAAQIVAETSGAPSPHPQGDDDTPRPTPAEPERETEQAAPESP